MAPVKPVTTADFNNAPVANPGGVQPPSAPAGVTAATVAAAAAAAAPPSSVPPVWTPPHAEKAQAPEMGGAPVEGDTEEARLNILRGNPQRPKKAPAK